MGQLINNNRENEETLRIGKKAKEDKTISLRAKYILMLFSSGEYDTIDAIQRQSKEGKEAIRTAIKELENNGYVTLTSRKNEKSQFDGYNILIEEDK